MDDFFGFIWLGVVLALGILLFVFGIMFILPMTAVGVGGWLIYKKFVEVPPQEIAKDRTAAMYQEALRHSHVDMDDFKEVFLKHLPDARLADVAVSILDLEGFRPPPPPPPFPDSVEGGRYRDRLLKYIENVRTEENIGDHVEVVSDAMTFFAQKPKDGIFDSRRLMSKDEMQQLILLFYEKDVFRNLKAILDRNYEEQGVLPGDYKGDNWTWDYLKDTPLLELEYISDAVALTNRTYHTHILGASGAGKSNLIEYMISRDLTGDEDNCVIVVDSQVQMIPKLADVDLDTDDVTYITPNWNLALNLFDVDYERMQKQGVEGERLINTTVDLISFVMEGMMGAQLSDPQKTIFQYAIQLVIAIPGGNVFTFFELLADDGHIKYVDQFELFDDNTQAFFMRDFGSNEYQRSRDAIRRRLQSMLRNPTFRRLFSAVDNKVDMYEEMKKRKLILIDTNLPMLGKDASAFFGRLFIALIVQASHRRFDNRGETYKPVYLYVDEAHEYFDNKISEMLEQARKANIGLIVAHQSISQARSEEKNIIDPLMVNTATKIVATGYPKDAAVMAGSMKTSASTIVELPQYTFGYYSRDTGFKQIRAVPDPLSNLPSRYNKSELQEATELRYGTTDYVSTATIDDDIDENLSESDNTAKQPDRETDLGTVEPI